MLNEKNIDLCWKVLSRYGVENQRTKVIEECAELIDAICHLKKAEDKKIYDINLLKHFHDEIVDVLVVCQQMILVERLSDKLDDMAKAKLERALKNE
jgi:NTP pyrophosphatase (non-canonical NTP hydrolase)